MKTKIQKYISRNQFNPTLEIFAQNEKGDTYNWKTNVEPSILEVDDKVVEDLIKENVSITLGEVATLTWHIRQKL